MKILHIIPALRTGGAERLVLDICRHLNLNVSLTIALVILRDDNHFEKEDFIKYIPASITLSIRGQNNSNLQALKSFFHEFKPDIIHSHLFEAEIVSRSIHYPKARWFSHFHDNMKQFKKINIKTILKKRNLTNFFEPRYFLKRYKKNGGNHFIAISEDTKNYALKSLGTAYPITLLPNAIDYDKYFIKDTREIHGTIKLINIGSFVPKKNQTFLIDILKSLHDININAELYLLGDGAEREKIKTKVKKLGLEDKVIFTGNVSNVPDYLKKANMYIHVAQYEPFGLVLLEAMAAGLPVITLDGKGNRDIVINEENGYIIKKQDSDLFN